MQEGDIVTTKEHAHRMTVHKIEGDKVIADYFDEHKHLIRREYNIEELTIES